MNPTTETLVNLPVPVGRLREDTRFDIGLKSETLKAPYAIHLEQQRTERRAHPYHLTLRPAKTPGQVAHKNPIHLS